MPAAEGSDVVAVARHTTVVHVGWMRFPQIACEAPVACLRDAVPCSVDIPFGPTVRAAQQFFASAILVEVYLMKLMDVVDADSDTDLPGCEWK